MRCFEGFLNHWIAVVWFKVLVQCFGLVCCLGLDFGFGSEMVLGVGLGLDLGFVSGIGLGQNSVKTCRHVSYFCEYFLPLNSFRGKNSVY